MSIIKNIETYTYLNETKDNKPLEVLLIGVNAESIGYSNNFEPTGFHRKHITTWLKKRYFFLNGTIYAQIPIQIKNYPDAALNNFDIKTNLQVTDVTISEDNIINIYYPISSSESVCVSWNINTNNWTMNVVSQPSDNTIIISEGYNANNESIWKSK